MPAEGGIASFIDGDADFDQNSTPETVGRKVRDAPCGCAFFLCVVGLVVFLTLTGKSGDYRRYESLTDYNGKFCGRSKSVSTLPFLFFCQDVNLEPRDRICLEECPGDGAVKVACPDGHMKTSYPTTMYAGLLCMPKDIEMRRKVNEGFFSDKGVEFFLFGIALDRAWPAILMSILQSIALSFLYMCLVSRCKKACLLICLSLVAFSIIAYGVYLLYIGATGGADRMQQTGDESASIVMGAVALFFGFGVLLVGCLYSKSINASIACIRAGSECIWDMPSLAFQPFLAIIVNIILLICLLGVFLGLATVTNETENRSSDGEVSRQNWLNYSWYHVLGLVFYLCMAAWIIEFFNNLNYLVTSYAAQLWFFAPYEKALVSKDAPGFAACKGYGIALRYYLGTIAYGSFCLLLFRVPRMFLGIIYNRADEEDEKKQSLSAKCMVEACPCCYSNYMGFLRYMTPFAYMDVSLNASSFCRGGYFSVQVMDTTDIRFLHRYGAAWLIQFTGQCLVASCGGILTFTMCKTGFLMSELGVVATQDAFYVPRPSFMGFVAFQLCWIASHPFMVLPSHVADNILFCFSIERRRLRSKPIQNAVESTGMLASFTSCTGSDRLVEHQAGSTIAQPPATHELLVEAKQEDLSWWS